MARTYQEKLPIAELETFLEPLLVYYKQSRQTPAGTPESFGDFCNRVDFESLRNFAASYQPSTQPEASTPKARSVSPSRAKIRHRIDIRDDVFQQIKKLAEEQGKSLPQMVTEAVASYLENLPKT
jgi:sulfite reductase (ferredoxin)